MSYKFNFNIWAFQAFLAQTSQNEWVTDSSCTHNMANDASLFSSLDTTTEKKIYVAYDFALDITSHGDVSYWYGWIIGMFHVLSISLNLLSVSQLTQIGKIVEL